MKSLGIILASLLLAVFMIVPAYADDYLCNGQVSPGSGDNWTVFTYTVWWTGYGNPPAAYVHIDGDYTGIMMTRYEGTYEYYYQTRLDSGGHYFYFTDSIGGWDPNQGDPAYVGPYVE